MTNRMIRTFLTVALAATTAAPVLAQRGIAGSDDRRGLLGVSLSCGSCYRIVGPGQVAYTRLPVITTITRNGAADRAGLRRGDTLATVDGLALTTADGLTALASIREGVAVRIGYRRGREAGEVTVTPGRSSMAIGSYYSERLRTAERAGIEQLRAAFRAPLGWLGMGLECEGCSVTRIASRSQAWTFSQPPSVLTVDVDGPAHRGGLRRGDLVMAIDGVSLTTREGGRAFAQIEPGQRVALTIEREGRSRQVNLTAVARPDASREEVAAFGEYRRMRDSSEARYRETLATSLQQAQREMQALEQAMRSAASGRTDAESRQRIASMDSILRELRSLERERARSEFPYVAAPAPRADAGPVIIEAPRARVSYPLRYSGRFADAVSIEARGPGAVNVQEVGDSLVVITSGGVEVRIARLPSGRR